MGIQIGDRCLFNLQFADDQVIEASDKDEMQLYVDVLNLKLILRLQDVGIFIIK